MDIKKDLSEENLQELQDLSADIQKRLIRLIFDKKVPVYLLYIVLQKESYNLLRTGEEINSSTSATQKEHNRNFTKSEKSID